VVENFIKGSLIEYILAYNVLSYKSGLNPLIQESNHVLILNGGQPSQCNHVQILEGSCSKVESQSKIYASKREERF
jgi:hypothetical protein